MACDGSNAVSIATSSESLLQVRDTIPGSHVVLLVPDVAITLCPWDVRAVVVPLEKTNKKS